MSDLEHLRVFVAVADAGGFAPAARRLRMSPPAVTRAIAALERHLGARLLHRTTRSVRLTDVGERFLADSRRILMELEEAEAAARGAHVEPQGLLSITASSMFGRLHVAPVLLDFLARHPKVNARTLFVDRIVHLIDEGFDVAVRIARLPDSSLTAVPVGLVRPVIVASPDYLAEHGEPQTPEELAQHRAIGFSQVGAFDSTWTFRRDDGSSYTATPRIQWVANDGEVAIAAAASGHGLSRAISYQVAEAVEAGRLRRVLQAYEPPAIPVQLVYPAGRKAAAKVRAFVDFAAEQLRARLA